MLNCCNFIDLEYMCHAYLRSDSLAGVLISDQEYPNRVSFTLLSKVGYLHLFALSVSKFKPDFKKNCIIYRAVKNRQKTLPCKRYMHGRLTVYT